MQNELNNNIFIEDEDPCENETDLEHILLSELSEAIIQSTDWTTGTLVEQINKGRIQLNPNFQRRDAWSDERKSKFIESLLLGFPIPQLVLAEHKNHKGRYIIIDGKQRLLSIMKFVGYKDNKQESYPPLRLKGLEILTQFNDKTFDDLLKGELTPDLEEFEGRTIRTAVIRHWKKDVILYHIFLRLNTGNVQLSPQELRNALHPGPFAEFIDMYSGNSNSLKRILKINKPDFRMRDAELLLRYYAFRNFLDTYAGSMKSFLDDTTEKLNKEWDISDQNIKNQLVGFEEAVDLAYKVFGEKETFRKWKDGKFIGRFNRAVYDIVLYHFCNSNLRDKIIQSASEVKKAFIEVSKTDAAFVNSLETSTKSLGATVTRFSLWTEALNRVLNIKLNVPSLVNNRIQLQYDGK